MRSSDDARHLHLSLTAAGKRAFAPLDRQSAADVDALLAALADGRAAPPARGDGDDRSAARRAARAAPRPGCCGRRAAATSAGSSPATARSSRSEYGWDMRFEALVARIAADFVDRFDAAREACWIAERDGVNVGCVFLVQARDETSGSAVAGTAQLRMLLVEPAARGLGIGARLVDECERFARAKGYRRIVLWTNSVLIAARAHLRQGRLRARRERAAPELRPRPGGRDLGARARLNHGTAVSDDATLAAAPG